MNWQDADDNDHHTEEEDPSFFNRQCLELAKLLRTEQTEHFLHLYDSLPAEWSGARLETAKEYIRQLQELDEHDFEQLYQGDPSTMSHVSEQSMLSGSSRITSSSSLKREQYYERTIANDQAYDEIHDVRAQPSSYCKMNHDDSNLKARRFPSSIAAHELTANKGRTSTPVDSFVQLNLTREAPPIDIKLEDYMKTIAATPTMKPSQHRVEKEEQRFSTRPSQTRGKRSTKSKSHQEAVFNYYPTHGEAEEEEGDNDDDDKPCSHSSSSTTCSTRDSSTSPTHDSLPGNLLRTSFPSEKYVETTPSSEHGKLIPNRGFDSHGSSTATKSSSDNSGSARTGSGSDSEDEHHRLHASFLQSSKSTSISKLPSYDNTPTMVLNQTSESRSSLYDGRISSLPEQNVYQLMQPTKTTEEHSLLASQVPRFKQPAMMDPNGTHELHASTTPRSQPSILTSSSQPTRTSDRDENQSSNPLRKTGTRSSKKRKQSQQQEIIRTESIPGHRGDLNVDELMMFIDGHSSTKSSSAPLRPTDTNSNGTTLRRKARKSTKQGTDNAASQIDENQPSNGFIDDDDDGQQSITNEHESHSLPTDESHSITLESDSQLTNGESSFSPVNDQPTPLNPSNSETISEPFVTVVHRRRVTKERRQEAVQLPSTRSSRFPPSSINDKRRTQPVPSSNRSSLSNTKSFVSTTNKEEAPQSILPPPPPPPSNAPHDPLSPRLSSHSSSSSLSSLLKRSSKPPPVVFLNKSADVELNGVSFGFDLDDPNAIEASKEQHNKDTHPLPPHSPTTSIQSDDHSSQFFSASDIHPQASVGVAPPPSFVDPLLILQYNQQRLAAQQLAYMNMMRAQYLNQQAQYVLVPTTYPLATSNDDNPDEKSSVDETNPPQESYVVYATIPTSTGQIYFHPITTTTKRSYADLDPSLGPAPSVYSSQFYYPNCEHLIPSPTAYFQPIPSTQSPSLGNENKSQLDESDRDELDDDDEEDQYERSTRLFHQSRQQASSHIMSNALQLVYSQERRQTATKDAFNLEQVTAYLAMRWTDTIDRYDQGDDEILFVTERP